MAEKPTKARTSRKKREKNMHVNYALFHCSINIYTKISKQNKKMTRGQEKNDAG